MTVIKENQSASVPPHVPQELVYDFSDIEPIMFEDPYARCREVAREAPRIFFTPGQEMRAPSWCLTHFSDIRAVAQNPQLFTSELSYQGPRPHVHGEGAPLIPLELDPPLHSEPRVMLAPIFSPKAMNAMQEEVRELVQELIKEMRQEFGAAPHIDFVESFARKLPSTVFCRLSGLPVDHSRELVGWNNMIIHGKTMEERQEGVDKISELLAELIDERRAEPKGDIISKVIHLGKLGGEPLGDKEIMGFCFLLFLGGLDTVTNALSNIFTYLALNPAKRDDLVENPGLIPSAIEELLRTHAVIRVGRQATQDTEINGVQIKAGDRVTLLYPMANFNEELFEDAEVVDFQREADAHLTFGVGPHRCVGSHLARKEIIISVQELLKAFPTLEIAKNERPKADCIGTFGYDYLPLALG